MDRGISLRTYLWLAGCLFLLAASLSFVAYLRFGLPWWAMVLMMGLLVAMVVEGLEHALARPLERLTKVSGRGRDGLPALPPPPAGLIRAQELQKLWKGMRSYQDHLTQARHAKQSLESQLGVLKGQLRILGNAARSLEPAVGVEGVAPWTLRELAAQLGLADLYLVPLRRHCPVPVTGAHGAPEWADAIRSSGLAPWEDLFAQNAPASLCLAPTAPAWREHWGKGALWAVPLVYHGKAQGLLLSPGGVERTFTADELTLVNALAAVLACALHPPRWSDERSGKPVQVQRPTPSMPPVAPAPVANVPAPVPAAVSEASEEAASAPVALESAGAPEPTPRPARRKRRQKKGA